MNKVTWQYIAGFFDGEGTIFYTTTWAKNRKTGKRNIKCKRLVVSVIQGIRQKQVIEEIGKFLERQRIGFSTVESKKPIPCLRLDIGVRGEQFLFLKSIFPYLIVKKEKAEKALKFIEEKEKTKKGNFTLREKDTILQMRKERKTYKQISKVIKRNPSNIMHCFYNLKKYGKNYST